MVSKQTTRLKVWADAKIGDKSGGYMYCFPSRIARHACSFAAMRKKIAKIYDKIKKTLFTNQNSSNQTQNGSRISKHDPKKFLQRY